MGHLSLQPSRRPTCTTSPQFRQWSLLDVAIAALFTAVAVFFILLLTPLGDSLAASGSQSLAHSHPHDPLRRDRVVAGSAVIDSCPPDDADYMPCEDSRANCDLGGETRICLVPPPSGYRIPVPWPQSLEKIWHDNMPYDEIAERKGHKSWMKEEGEYFIFPGGSPMFPEGAAQYIAKLQQFIPSKEGLIRTALDMGCGDSSFGGYMLKENVSTLSFAPRDSHKAPIQFALERGIPAFVAVLGTHRLPFSSYSFDLVHCSRCSIQFTSHNGTYLVEVDRLLRPGGYLVISGPPVQWAKQDKEWGDLQAMTRALCYELIAVDGNTAIWKKPSGSSCLPSLNEFSLGVCNYTDPDEAWYFKLKKCVSKVSFSEELAIGSIPNWPVRLTKPPVRLSLIRNGVDVFEADSRRWRRRVAYYKKSLGIKLGTPNVRNVMDMNALFGGFAAALESDPVWVMNVIPPHKPLTLGIIYDRGLIGVYHDWCEAFPTYPRTYDLIHVTAISSLIRPPTSRKSCHIVDLMVEMDRILRPEGTLVVRDAPEVIDKVSRIAHAIRWNVRVHEREPGSFGDEKILVATKRFWKLPQMSS